MTTTSPEVTTRTLWKIDPTHSSVEFRVKHMLVTTVRGRFTDVAGDLYGDLDNPLDGEVDVTIDAASVDTRQEQRDVHLRSADFLDVENFPTITFKSTGVEVLEKDHLHISGDLTIHGVTRPVTLDTHINGTGKTPFGTEVVGASATTSFNRKDFGLNWNVALEAGGWLVGDKINVDLEIEAVKQV